MKTKAELIAELYSRGTSRGMCPKWFQDILAKINESL